LQLLKILAIFVAMFLVSITFLAAFGNDTKEIEITSPNGGGGCGYHILVDRAYWGSISNTMLGWRVQFQHPKDEFSGGYLQVLIDMVTGENQT